MSVAATAEVLAEASAPAKVNLALHVVGRRADGYHLLDSLAVFPAIGDQLRLRPAVTPRSAGAEGIDFVVTAPPDVLVALGAPADNLVVRAARALAARAGADVAPVTVELEKRLPIAAGLGGGSADAAAALRLLAAHWRLRLTEATLAEIALSLGADVPMCLVGRPVRAGGVGEILTPLPPLPPLAILLVNPGVPVPTPAVFRRLERRDNPALPPFPLHWRDAASFLAWLGATRNDLTAPAVAEAPVIGDVLSALAASEPAHCGMSGSGATCFALYPTLTAAERAASRLPAGWWRAAAPLA